MGCTWCRFPNERELNFLSLGRIRLRAFWNTGDANHIRTNNSVGIPCLVLASINAYNLWNEHWEHWSHLPPLEERVEYPYQNIRTKNYQWGDGDKVSSMDGLGVELNLVAC